MSTCLNVVMQMYRPSQYTSWVDAENSGGVHGFSIHSIADPASDEGILGDIIEGVCTAVSCMDGSESIIYRVLVEDFLGAYSECMSGEYPCV